jgi:ADP-heptose:LPS heptosyltransferase
MFDLKKARHLLFIHHLLAIGDAIFLSPVFKTIKDNIPGSHITILTREYIVDFLRMIPCIDRIHTIESLFDRDDMKIKAVLNLIRYFMKNRYDYIILRNDPRTPHWRKIYIATRLSYSKTLSIAPYLAEHVNEKTHIVDTYKLILETLGFKVNWEKELYIKMDAHCREKALDHLRSAGISGEKPIIGICPTSGLNIKSWGIEDVTRLCESLDIDADIVIFSTRMEAFDVMSKHTKGIGMVVGNTTFENLIGLISHCSLFIGVDTGPTHIAAALKIPTIGLYGPTSEIITGPYGEMCRTIRSTIDCQYYRPTSPFSPKEDTQVCYIKDRCYRNGISSCMEFIEVDDVLPAVYEMLKNSKGVKD